MEFAAYLLNRVPISANLGRISPIKMLKRCQLVYCCFWIAIYTQERKIIVHEGQPGILLALVKRPRGTEFTYPDIKWLSYPNMQHVKQ